MGNQRHPVQKQNDYKVLDVGTSLPIGAQTPHLEDTKFIGELEEKRKQRDAGERVDSFFIRLTLVIAPLFLCKIQRKGTCGLCLLLLRNLGTSSTHFNALGWAWLTSCSNNMPTSYAGESVKEIKAAPFMGSLAHFMWESRLHTTNPGHGSGSVLSKRV